MYHVALTQENKRYRCEVFFFRKCKHVVKLRKNLVSFLCVIACLLVSHVIVCQSRIFTPLHQQVLEQDRDGKGLFWEC